LSIVRQVDKLGIIVLKTFSDKLKKKELKDRSSMDPYEQFDREILLFAWEINPIELDPCWQAP
jgi:ABC-type transporter lipoprotein component MlaA